MELAKVIYQFGNNNRFDYYILDTRKNAIENDIHPESISYKLIGPGKIKVSKYCQIIFGNFDYLLIKMNKGTDIPCGYTLASEEDVKIID